MRNLFASLRIRLMLLVMLGSLPVLLWMLYSSEHDRLSAAAVAQGDALRVARLAADQQALLIEQVRQDLGELAQLLVAQPGSPPLCSTLYPNLKAQYAQQYPPYANLGLIDRNGQIYCSVTSVSGPVDVAERVYFQRALQTLSFAIGDYEFDPASGKTLVSFGYPVLTFDGQARVVLFAALDLGVLNQFAMQMRLPEGSTFTILDRNGTILIRYPEAEAWVGRAAPHAPILAAIRTAQGEGTSEADDLDGVRRLYAFVPLGSAPEATVYASVGIPASVVFARTNEVLTRNLIGLGLAIAGLLVAAWVGGDFFVLQPVNVLVRATKHLSAGDLSARTGLASRNGELSQLARAFDEMAEALELRERERQHAEEALRQAHAELQAAVKEIEMVTYTVSHDLRAPLRAVNGFAHLLREEHALHLAPEAQGYLQRIEQNALLMGQLVDNLLDFIRLNRRPLRKSLVALGDIARQVVEELRIEQADRHIAIAIGDLPPCQADAALIRQVYLHLLGNALKFTRGREAPRIEVGYKELEGAPAYFVRDNGVGFDMRYAHKLFNVFQQLHTAEGFEGTGVGLASVQRIVHRHGGRVWAEGEVEKGACFYFSLK